jgi:hypothetical protein
VGLQVVFGGLRSLIFVAGKAQEGLNTGYFNRRVTKPAAKISSSTRQILLANPIVPHPRCAVWDAELDFVDMQDEFGNAPQSDFLLFFNLLA